MTTPQTIEETPGQRLCRAFAETFNGGGWADPPTWESFDANGQARWEAAAKRADELHLQALQEAGFAVVPRTATPEMLTTVCDPRNVYQQQCYADDWAAMIEAAMLQHSPTQEGAKPCGS